MRIFAFIYKKSSNFIEKKSLKINLIEMVNGRFRQFSARVVSDGHMAPYVISIPTVYPFFYAPDSATDAPTVLSGRSAGSVLTGRSAGLVSTGDGRLFSARFKPKPGYKRRRQEGLSTRPQAVY